MSHGEETYDEADASGQPKWVAIQQKTFTKWLNNHLVKKGYGPMSDVQTEFEDGNKLMEVINALYDTKLPAKRNKAPKMRPHKLDNLTLAFQMLEEAQIKTNFLKNTHLLDHDLKMILGMIWAIILDYAIKGISVGELTAKEGLLLWCRKKTTGYTHIDPPGIKNFKNDWKNGLAFCALIHRHRPDLLDYSALSPDNQDYNLKLAFDVAEKHLGIPRLLDVEDFKGVPDERSVMTYVSEYFHRFASQDQRELSAKRVANFLKFMRDMQAREDEYARRAGAFLAWVDGQVKRLGNRDFGETLGEAQAANAALRNFVVSERPAQEGEKIDVENLFAEIQTELKINNRKPYVPPAGLSPDDLEAGIDRLSKAQKEYSLAVRQNRFRFVKKIETKISDEKIAEMEASFKHFDANKSDTLDKLEFKAALSAMSVFFKDEGELDSTFASVAQGGTHVSLAQYVAFLTQRFQDKDTPEQIKESFRAVADGGTVISAAQLATPPLSAEDAAYLQSVLPATDGGYDYSAFVDSSYE